MKLLFVCEFFPSNKELKFSGGVESYSYHLINELSKNNQITVLTSNTSSKEDLINKNLKVLRVGPKINRVDSSLSTIPKRFLFQISALLIGLKQDFDLVQGDNFVTHPVAFLIGFLKRKPTVSFYADVFIGKWIKISGLLTGIFGELSERFSLLLPWTKIVALSLTTRQKLEAQNISANKLEVIYGGVSSDFFNGKKIQKYSDFTVLYVGRLVGYKNVDTLIKSVGILKTKKQNVNLTIVGVGPEKNNLLKLVEKLNLTEQVSFREDLSRAELVKEFKKSHLFVLPSSEEGFGLVVIEAAASGVPYIVSDIPVLKEVTQNFLGGMSFKLNDSADLAEKIKKNLNNSKLRSQLQNQALVLAKSYQWDSIAKQYETVYQTLIQKKTKVLMLVDAWFPHFGGGQVHVWELSKRLVDLGLEVIIYTRDLGRWNDKYPGVKVIRQGYFKKFSNPLGRVEYLIRALVYCLVTRHDLLHTHAFSPGLLVPIIKMFKKNPVVFTVHGTGVKIAGFGVGGKYLEDIVFYKVPYDLEITVARNTLVKLPSAKIIKVIPNGVDIQKFKSKYRVRTSVKRILYVGRLSQEKGVDILIQAFAKINSKSKLKLVIAGSGRETANLKKLANGLKIDFIGSVMKDQLIEEYKKADLLVIPSRTEGQPLVLLEGWAMGLPILATRVGDNDKFIKHGVNGFLAEPNFREFFNELKKTLNYKYIQNISDSGLKEVEKYSWKKIADQTYRAYKMIYKI